MALSLSVLSCCASPIFFFAGVVLLIVGVPTWMITETWEEGQEHEVKRIESDIRRFELNSLKNKEVQMAQDRELVLRKKLKSQIENCLPKDVCEVQETKIEDLVARYDFVIHFKAVASQDILIRVTYTKAHPNIKILDKRIRLVMAELGKRLNLRLATRAVIIVLHEKPPYVVRGFLNRITLKQANVIVQDLSEWELDELACEKLLRLLFPVETYPQYPWEKTSQ